MNEDVEIVLSQLQRLEVTYKDTPKGLLAYTVQKYLRLAIRYGNANDVLNDPALQTVFLDARLATDCGWRPPSTQN
jgi:hypothetical protein